MKFLGEYIREAANEEGLVHLDTELGNKLGISRQAVYDALRKLDKSVDNIKLFKKYMKALNREIEIQITVKNKTNK